MSELKEVEYPNCFGSYYRKDEADKVIAELKKERNWLAKDRAQAYDDLEKRAQLNIKQEESIRHHKYKRCLGNAEICCEKKENCYNRALRKYTKDEADYLVSKSEFWQDWEFRWLELADKFKDETQEVSQCRPQESFEAK